MATRFTIVCDTPNALWSFDKRDLKKIFRQAGQEISTTAKGLMRASAGWTRRGGKRVYQGSQPGDAPAKLTGALIRGIKVYPFRNGMGVRVSSTVLTQKEGFYGLFLETGVQYQTNPINRPVRQHSARTAPVVVRAGQTTVLPRPYLSKAIAMKAPDLQLRIAAAVDQGVRFVKQK